MKLLVLAFLFSSPSAFAMHAYATDNCSATSRAGKAVSIELSNGTPASPHRLVRNDDGDILWVNLSTRDDSTDMSPEESALVLKTTAIRKGPSKRIDDGCFQGSSWTYLRTAIVTAVNAQAMALTGLRVGETLHFRCDADYQAPTGPHCDDNN